MVGLQQCCPECKNGEGLIGVGEVLCVAPAVECWRCDNHGLVEPYDDDSPLIIVHDAPPDTPSPGEETNG